MINLRGAFDPASGAPIKLAIETLVCAELHAARDARCGFGAGAPVEAAFGAAVEGSGASGPSRDSEVDPLLAEDRSIAQMNAHSSRATAC